MTAAQRAELGEIFRLVARESSFDAAVETIGNAAVMYAAGLSRARRPPKRAVDRLSILRPVAAALGTSCEALRTNSRERRFVHPRWLAMWLLRQPGQQWPRLSYPKIAELLWMRNHTTVVHGVRAVEADPVLLAKARAALGMGQKDEAA